LGVGSAQDLMEKIENAGDRSWFSTADGCSRVRASVIVRIEVEGRPDTPHDPVEQSCHFNATVQQTVEVVGGTGRFSAASGSFTGTGSGPALLARNPDGSCSFEQDALHEVD